MKLLIADDQLSVHRFFEKSIDFSLLGITQTLHAYDGGEALKIIQKENPDICILDIEMPVMNGIMVLEQLLPESKTKILILSAYDQFEYARQCMKYGVLDYILKPIDMEEINQKLQNIISQIRKENERTLNTELKLLLAEEEFSERMINEFSESFYKLNIKQYGMICGNQSDVTSPDFTEGVISPLLSFSFQQNRFYFFSVKEPEEWNTLYRCMAGTRSLRLGFSLLQQLPSQLPVCLRQCREALLQGFYRAGVCLYQENYFTRSPIQLSGELTRMLLDCMKLGSMAQVTKTVDKIFSVFAQNRVHPENVYEFCCTVLMYSNSDNGMIADHPFYIPSQSMFYGGAALIKNRFLHAVESQLERNGQSTAKTDIEIVEEIKDYADNHYDCDLSLENVEGLFFISKYQVSRIFKKLYGINFQDYLLQTRMEKAKLLLQDTTMKLYEVAQKIGFKEASYFSMVFKKYFGLSPHDFRLQAAEQNQILSRDLIGLHNWK